MGRVTPARGLPALLAALPAGLLQQLLVLLLSHLLAALLDQRRQTASPCSSIVVPQSSAPRLSGGPLPPEECSSLVLRRGTGPGLRGCCPPDPLVGPEQVP